jgi:type II secretory pathway predicted ATPase ExeA/cell division septation protein DedD
VSQQLPKVPFESGRILRHVVVDAQSAAPPQTPFAASLTYELYYGLKEKPFSLASDPRFLYRSPTHGPAFDALLNGIRRREGLIVLTGEIGTGKTTLIRAVLQQLDRRTFSAFVPDPFVSREDLLKMLLVDFGVVSVADLKRGSLNGASRPDLSYPLYEFLDSLVPLQAFAVAIMDEAQNLPLPLLEEVRILSDLDAREKLLQVVLVGQPELRANLRLPQMRQVNQRISVRCELMPLRLDDLDGYVRHRLIVAGDGDCRVEFSTDALAAVHRRSGGTPRLINLICDRALTRGHEAKVATIEPEHVAQGIRDLGLDEEVRVTTSIAPLGFEDARSDDSWVEDDLPASAPTRPAALAAAESNAGAASSPAESPVASSTSASRREPTSPLAEFAAEGDVSRSVRILPPPPRSWRAPIIAAVVATLAVCTLLFSLVVAAYDRDPTVLTLPPAPPRPPASALNVPAISARWPVGGAAPAPQKTLPPPVAKPVAAAADDTAERFAIQVASFSTQVAADLVIDELSRSGYKARAVAFDFGPPRGSLVQVLIGTYASPAEAESDLARIHQQSRFTDARIERIARH